MINKNTFLIAFSILLWSVILVGGTVFFFRKKIGYVRNGVLISKSEYMKEVSDELDKEVRILRSNADTLRNRYEALKAMEGDVKSSDKMEWSYKLGVAENNYLKYMENAEADMAEQRKKLTGEALDKINGIIKSYAEKNGYDYILGTTNEGNILFGAENDDITEEILERVNEEYSKEEQRQKP